MYLYDGNYLLFDHGDMYLYDGNYLLFDHGDMYLYDGNYLLFEVSVLFALGFIWVAYRSPYHSYNSRFG